MPKEPAECKYLVDGRLCKAVMEQSEGRDVRKEFCKNSRKDYCCYLCEYREKCEISCSFLDTPKETKIPDTRIISKIEREIKAYEEEKAKLAVLFANQKIGEKSYLAATKALESKITELKKAKESPTLSQETIAKLYEADKFEEENSSEAKPTALWYLVPFFFGLIGGIIAYVGTNDKDEQMAYNLLVFGIIWTIILIVVYFILF
ncbi:MAG: hypothetical protein QXF82_06850 [Nitrososphaeria archaeon]